MPVLHEYTNGDGYYIRSAFQGKIVTYKVTPAGIDYINRRGYVDGSDISPRVLDQMRKKKYIYTGGSGPGEIDDWYWEDNPQPSRSKRVYKATKKPVSSYRKKSSKSCAPPCCSQIMITLLGLILLAGIWASLL